MIKTLYYCDKCNSEISEEKYLTVEINSDKLNSYYCNGCLNQAFWEKDKFKKLMLCRNCAGKFEYALYKFIENVEDN